MKIDAYLRTKYGEHVKALSAVEAKILGIPYPLKSGWPAKYGKNEITKDQALELCESLSAKNDRYSRRAAEALLREFGDQAISKDVAVTVPVPDVLLDVLQALAKLNRRSVSEEIVWRLEESCKGVSHG